MPSNSDEYNAMVHAMTYDDLHTVFSDLKEVKSRCGTCGESKKIHVHENVRDHNEASAPKDRLYNTTYLQCGCGGIIEFLVH